jgi:hypothetical protein
VPGFFEVRTHPVAQSDVASMNANQIMDILHNLDVQGVTDAANAHLALGKQLDEVTGQLRKHATTLHAAWQGSAAQSAMDTFQSMHEQTALLAAQAKQTGQVLRWTAGVMQQYKDLPAPQGQSTMAADQQAGANALSGAGTEGKVLGAAGGTVVGGLMDMFGAGHSAQEQANQKARQYLTSLNTHLIAANNALPSPIGMPSIGTTPLGPAHAQGSSAGSNASHGGVVAGAPPVSGAGAGAGAGASAVTAPASGAGSASGIHKFSSAGLTPTGQGPTATLQGYSPPPGGANTLPPPGTGGAGPAAGPAGPGGLVPMPGGPVPGTGPGDNVPTDSLAAEDTALPVGPGAGGGTAGPDGAAAEAAAGDGVIGDEMPGMMPGMGGAAGGAPGEELGSDEYALREVNPDLAANGAASRGVIGDEAADAEAGAPMMGGGSGSRERDKERRRQAWMDEDADIWGRPADNIPSVIEGGG